MRTLIDWVPDFLYLKDLEGRFVVSNRAHFAVLGAERQEEVLGKTDFDVFPKEFAERYSADEKEVFRTGLPHGRDAPSRSSTSRTARAGC